MKRYNNWYLDIDFNLEECVIVFLEAWIRADFSKAVPSNYNSEDMLYSLSYKVQQTFKFSFRQLKCHHIWYMLDAIKVIKKLYLIYPVAK